MQSPLGAMDYIGSPFNLIYSVPISRCPDTLVMYCAPHELSFPWTPALTSCLCNPEANYSVNCVYDARRSDMLRGALSCHADRSILLGYWGGRQLSQSHIRHICALTLDPVRGITSISNLSPVSACYYYGLLLLIKLGEEVLCQH